MFSRNVCKQLLQQTHNIHLLPLLTPIKYRQLRITAEIIYIDDLPECEESEIWINRNRCNDFIVGYKSNKTS